jgi:hypothetical protein
VLLSDTFSRFETACKAGSVKMPNFSTFEAVAEGIEWWKPIKDADVAILSP